MDMVYIPVDGALGRDGGQIVVWRSAEGTLWIGVELSPKVDGTLEVSAWMRLGDASLDLLVDALAAARRE